MLEMAKNRHSMMLVYLGTLQGNLGTLKDALAQLKNKMDRSGEETKQEGPTVCISKP